MAKHVGDIYFVLNNSFLNLRQGLFQTIILDQTQLIGLKAIIDHWYKNLHEPVEHGPYTGTIEHGTHGFERR
jgi:hypothetical protein